MLLFYSKTSLLLRPILNYDLAEGPIQHSLRSFLLLRLRCPFCQTNHLRFFGQNGERSPASAGLELTVFTVKKHFLTLKKQPTYIGCSLTKTATFASLSPPPSAPLSLLVRCAKKRVLKNMLGWLANSESSFLMKRKH